MKSEVVNFSSNPLNFTSSQSHTDNPFYFFELNSNNPFHSQLLEPSSISNSCIIHVQYSSDRTVSKWVKIWWKNIKGNCLISYNFRKAKENSGHVVWLSNPWKYFNFLAIRIRKRRINCRLLSFHFHSFYENSILFLTLTLLQSFAGFTFPSLNKLLSVKKK